MEITCGFDHYLVRTKMVFLYRTDNSESQNKQPNGYMEEIQWDQYNMNSFFHESIQVYKTRLDNKLNEQRKDVWVM